MAKPDDPDEWLRQRFVDSRASAGSEGSLARTRYEFARHDAAGLASSALPAVDVTEYIPPSQVSLRTVLFTDTNDDALIVVVGGHEPAKEVEKALPYSLEHVGDRDLVFVVPAGTEWPMLARLPWLDQHARVFTHEKGQVAEHVVPLRVDVLDEIAARPAAPGYALSAEHVGWADEVIAWANGHPRLAASHRSAYLGWKADGRLVLKIARASSKRLRISAGASSPKVTELVVEIDGPLADPEAVREVVRRAIADRVTGTDTANVEHRFQARLQLLDPSERLGLVTFIPEFPANRPGPGGQAAGSIDFLGVDEKGRLHVVETKVGASESTVFLQALDYWIWVEANRAALAAELGADPELTADLSVIVLPKADGELFHRHNAYVRDRLARSVPLSTWRAEVGLDSAVRLHRVNRWQTAAGSRFSDRMRRRTYAVAAMDGVGAGTRSEPTAGIHRDSRTAADVLEQQGGLHSHVHLANSSQRFALDLYGSLSDGGTASLLTRYFGPMATVSGPQFEWTDEEDTLRESTNLRPARTQVDVMLDGATIDGRRVALLVEVKLTESAFGGCSHATHAPEDARSTCRQSGPFGNNPAACFQLRNRDLGDRRRYDEFVSSAGPSTLDVAAGCWFLERNQPMRLAALAGALVATNRYDECRAVLTAPQAHQSMRRRWAESTAMLGESVLGLLEPGTVMNVLDQSQRLFLVGRYGVESSHEE